MMAYWPVITFLIAEKYPGDFQIIFHTWTWSNLHNLWKSTST